MGLIEALRDGRHGVQLSLPDWWCLNEEREDALKLTEVERGASWFFYVFPGLHLDLAEEHRDGLRRGLEWPARGMFEALSHAQERGGEERPRTVDPSWSPMVDVEHLLLDGSPALRTVHRMAYEPGREVIMGHLLVPLRQGLFEARVICGDSFTGLRETVLLEARMADRPAEGEPAAPPAGLRHLRQADYDDPEHDSAFPEHALSRTRAALRWLTGEADLRVLECPETRTETDVELPDLGCVLRAPPRFVHEPSERAGSPALFHRVSFCGTDGVQHLVVTRDDAPLRPGRLRDEAVARARRLHEADGVRDIVVRTEEMDDAGGRPQVLTIVEGNGHLGRLRNAMCWLLDEGGRPWSLCLTATAVVPPEVLAAEVSEAARSLRITSPPPPRRPWWRPW